MAKVYRMSDKRQVKIGDVTIHVSPLNSFDKAEIAEEATKATREGSTKGLLNVTYKVLKKCLKKVDGIHYNDNESFVLEFEDKEVKDESLDELMTLEINNEMIAVCMALMGNFSTTEFVNPDTGVKLANVEIVEDNKGK